MKILDKGVFITIEGSDGTGKTTQCALLVDHLKSLGFDVVHTREPGGTPLAEKIRGLLLHKDDTDPICGMTELLLFAAARAQHIQAVIKPALRAGKIVVCDRFSDSTFAYQGAGRGFVHDVLKLEHMVHQGFEPDCTLFFHAPEQVCLERLANRSGKMDRLDQESLDFKHNVYLGYLTRYNEKKHRMSYIDASKSKGDVANAVRDWVNGFLIPSIESKSWLANSLT